MTRPRESILNLFDPLNANDPSTPKRIAVSPDSDKENSAPNEPGEVTAFFSKTYSRQIIPISAYSKPMKRLVDIGDITLALDQETDTGLEMVMEEDEDEVQNDEDKNDDDNEMESTPRPEGVPPMSQDDAETPMQRIPFTDITPEATPIARKRTYRRDEISCVTASTTLVSSGLTRAPPGSPLASIINAVNFSDGDTDTNTAPEHDKPHGQIPQISVSSPSNSATARAPSTTHPIPSSSSILPIPDPDYVPVSELEPPDTLACSTEHLVPSATSSLLTNIPLSLLPLADSVSESTSGPSSPPPRLSPSTSPSRSPSNRSRQRSGTLSPTKSNDPVDTDSQNPGHTRRTSIDIDLHSSFNIHLQNPESSFDLLNDRISFFGLDNSLSTRMDTSVVGPGMGMESSLIDKEAGLGVDNEAGGVSMCDFDVKDEEGRMRAFLGMSGDWEGLEAPEDTKAIEETPSSGCAPTSVQSSELPTSQWFSQC